MKRESWKDHEVAIIVSEVLAARSSGRRRYPPLARRLYFAQAFSRSLGAVEWAMRLVGFFDDGMTLSEMPREWRGKMSRQILAEFAARSEEQRAMSDLSGAA